MDLEKGSAVLTWRSGITDNYCVLFMMHLHSRHSNELIEVNWLSEQRHVPTKHSSKHVFCNIQYKLSDILNSYEGHMLRNISFHSLSWCKKMHLEIMSWNIQHIIMTN